MASSGLTQRDVELINRIFAQHPEVEKAILYGSRALGTFKKGSDIDLALQGEMLTDRVCTKIHFELEEDIPLPYFFDVTHYASINNDKLKAHIDQLGKVFYCASSTSRR